MRNHMNAIDTFGALSHHIVLVVVVCMVIEECVFPTPQGGIEYRNVFCEVILLEVHCKSYIFCPTSR
jgi:hypothetical protein